MSTLNLSSRLSSLDALFLYYENEQAPLHIGSVVVLEGEVPFEHFVAHVEAQLPKLPRYRQIIASAPLGLSHPAWEDDPTFNIRRHVLRVQVAAPGGNTELQQLSAQIFEGMLDRSKPLWELYMVYGLAGGRCALITKVHHAMVDGKSAVELGTAIMSISPEVPPVRQPEPTRPAMRKQQRRSLPRRVASALQDSRAEMRSGWKQLQLGLLSLVEALVDDTDGAALKGATKSLISLARPATALPFNRLATGEKSFAWNEVTFDEVRAIRRALGGTVNDVVLAVLSGAVARYTRAHGQTTKGKSVRFMSPVSTRCETQREALGNLVSLIPVEIPLDLNDPAARLRFITRTTEALKSARVADGMGLNTALMAMVPAPLQALAGGLLNRSVSLLNRKEPPRAVAFLNMVCTNVPGPSVPFYLLGRRAVAVYPYVPTVHSAACNVAVMSYGQKLWFGLSIDAGAMPDGELFSALLAESFAELRAAAGLTQSPQPAPQAQIQDIVVRPIAQAPAKERKKTLAPL